MTDLSLLADRVRAEIVGRGQIPIPLLVASATEAVEIAQKKSAGDAYLAARLTLVLHHLESGRIPMNPGPATPDIALDARIALGEYETLLALKARDAV